MRAASDLPLKNPQSALNSKFPPTTQASSTFFDSVPQSLDLALERSHVHDFAQGLITDQQTDNLDFLSTNGAAQDELLQDAVFPEWRDDAITGETFETPEEMQQKDPLNTQLWKLFNRTKTKLPNQERMENLTWRMMAMNLRRREQQQQQAAYVGVPSSRPSLLTGCSRLAARKAAEQAAANFQEQNRKRTPKPQPPRASGIAQLRGTSQATTEPFPDAMNLDDFIVPTSMASPAGLPTPSSSDAPQHAIAVNHKHKDRLAAPAVPANSVPRDRNNGFDGLPRRMRKTSIDERRSVRISLLIPHDEL